jgi:hypothetical protein
MLAVRLAVSFTKARPPRRAFACLVHLLCDCPLLVDQLQQSLAAISQAATFLEHVDYFDRVRRQLKQHVFYACLAAAATMDAGFFSERLGN